MKFFNRQTPGLKKLSMWRDRQLHSLRTAMDIARDKRICGVSLEDNVISPFQESHGCKDTIHTPYGSMNYVFAKESFTQDDILLDVGCGLGRPLAYFIDTGFPGKLVGVEINDEVAERARQWTSKYQNVQILSSDVFEVDLSPFTVLFMWTPMIASMMQRFFLKLETEALQPVKIYYLSDQQIGDFLDKRPGWCLKRRDWIHRVHGIPQHGVPERFSVWEYTPVSKS